VLCCAEPFCFVLSFAGTSIFWELQIFYRWSIIKKTPALKIQPRGSPAHNSQAI